MFRTCQEVVVQKERLASLDQASVAFVHANNPIPKVSGNRISRFRGVSCYSVVSTGSSPIFENNEPKLLSKNSLTPFYNGAGLRTQGVYPLGPGVSRCPVILRPFESCGREAVSSGDSFSHCILHPAKPATGGFLGAGHPFHRVSSPTCTRFGSTLTISGERDALRGL